jgi:DnaJ-class molecular chaperone
MADLWSKLLDRHMIECPACQGWGQRFTSTHRVDPSAKARWYDCDECNGRGEIPAPEEEEDGNDDSGIEE